MTIIQKNHRDFFFRLLATVAITGSTGLVAAAGTLPEGLEKGELIVSGFGLLLGVLAAAVAVRAAYALGFSKALKTGASQRRSALTA